jgi:precorrin-2 dehydrogenase/sirohydrochlorin ferrochelatase
MRYYPLFLDLTGRRVVVVGGGRVAERKVRQLLDCRAEITLISPIATPRLQAWHRAGRLRWQKRCYRRSDLRGAWLAVSATDQSSVSRQVATDGARRKIWTNMVDDPGRSSVIAPAWFRRGALVIAFSTGGASPALAQQLRRRLSKEIGRDYAAYVALLARLRRRIHRQVSDSSERQRLMRRLVRADLLPLIRSGRHAALAHRVTHLVRLKK